MSENLVLTVFLMLTTLKEGWGTVDFVDPPSGSVIANFEGTPNATTIICNVTLDGGPQITTQWNVANFRGSGSNLLAQTEAPELFSVGGDPIPGTNFLFDNELTILNWAAELDGVIVYCGTGRDPQEASFTLRIYRSIKLQDDFLVKIEEGSRNITVELRQDPAAFPEPTLFSWSKDGQPLSATELALTYSSVTIDTVRRADAGNYTITATNFVLPGSLVANQVSNDTGSFYLDVIFAELFCNVSVSSINGAVTVTWSYIHTGGLSLTNVSVSYSIENNLSPIPIPLISVDTTSVTIPDVKAGFEYTFNVTAESSEGSSSTVCGPITPKSVVLDSNPNILITAIVGGVVGGLVGILLISLLGFSIAVVTLGLKRRGNQIKLEAVYEDPDNLQPYTPKKDIELEECPAYVEKKKGEIELEECPAYGQAKKDEDIKLEECPAYVERKDDIKLEECPAYGQHSVQERPR